MNAQYSVNSILTFLDNCFITSWRIGRSSRINYWNWSTGTQYGKLMKRFTPDPMECHFYCIHTHTLYIYVYLFVYMYMCIYTHMYICIYTHTYNKQIYMCVYLYTIGKYLYSVDIYIYMYMYFPVVLYRCESWTIKKAEC